MGKLLWHVVVVVFIWMGIGCGNAFGYSSVVAFGDSLSDNGNLGRATDGPLWVELLADHLKTTLYDFAFVGAATGFTNPLVAATPGADPALINTGLLSQVTAYSSFVSTDSLITVWAGANDLVYGVSDPGTAVNNIDTALEGLYAAGGRNFLVPNLPDIGKTPRLLADPDPSAAAASFCLDRYFRFGFGGHAPGIPCCASRHQSLPCRYPRSLQPIYGW